MVIPKFLSPFLASYNLSQLDLINDKNIIITEILNKGDDKALRWITKNYSQKEIKDVVASPIKGFWMRSTLKYWLRIFEINLSQNKFESAIINLDI